MIKKDGFLFYENIKEKQDKCCNGRHGILRCDYWLRSRCVICLVLKWNWQWKKIKSK